MEGDARALDLAHLEDPPARVDLDVVATESSAIVQIQGAAEGEAVPRTTIDAMMDLALRGTARLVALQRAVPEKAGVDLARLTRVKGASGVRSAP